MKNTPLDYVKALLASCPVISLEGIQTDQAREEDMIYSISPEPVAPTTRRYLRGGAKKQLVFHLFCWKPALTDELREQNYRNYAALDQWMNGQNAKRDFPPMENGQQAIEIAVIGSPYEHDKAEDAGTALYGMQCVFFYYEKGEV